MGNSFGKYISGKIGRFKDTYRDTKLGYVLNIIFHLPDLVCWKATDLKKEFSATWRRLGFEDRRFMPLRAYKDRYKGKRVFVACTGPSLTISDLEMLEGEYVFGMNSICKVTDKTAWRPDFYAIQDSEVFDKLQNDLIGNNDVGQVFVPLDFSGRNSTPDNWIYWYHNIEYKLFSQRVLQRKPDTRFSGNCYAVVYEGYQITYSIIQLAIYMGFNEIYLIGADCNYSNTKQHFIESGHMIKDTESDRVRECQIRSYRRAKKYADKYGIKICNATRGGHLEVFERVVLEEVLKDKSKSKDSI